MALLALLFLGVPFLFVPREELAALVPGAAAVLAIESGTGLRRGRLPRARRLAAIAVAIVALVAAARQPFFIRNSAYGAFSAPLAVAVSLGWLGRRVKARRSFACFLVALAAFHGNERLRERRSYPAEPLEAAGLRVVLPAAEARFLRATVAALERSTPPGSYVACFPEPGSVLFAAGRRSPFVDTSFYPGQQDAAVPRRSVRSGRSSRDGSDRLSSCAMTLPGHLLPGSRALVSVTSLAVLLACGFAATAASAADSGVAVLLVDTDRVAGTIDERIYGHFLEHINHSVVDGLYAEQVRGQGFEGKDFADYWTPFGENGEATLVGNEVRAGRAQRAARRAEGRCRDTSGPPLPRSGADVRRLAMARSRAGHAGREPAHPELDRT